jgi:hypothetical protein
MHGTLPGPAPIERTVAPGEVIRVRTNPFWFGTRQISFGISEAVPSPQEFICYTHGSSVPAQLTTFGNIIAPDVPGRYISSIVITYESYIPAGSGIAYYLIMFTVE